MHCILKPGDSPETFQPDDAAMTRAARASIYLAAGVPFEHGRWFDALTTQPNVTVVNLQNGLTLRAMQAHHHEDKHDHDDPSDEGMDPHTWTSPANLSLQAESIARALIARFPEHQAAYEVNLAAVQTELRVLDEEIQETLARHNGRSMLVFHPAWGYFTDRYGLTQLAIEVEGKAPKDHELSELQASMRVTGVPVIFVQPQTGRRIAETVAKAIGGEVVVLDPLGENVPGNLRRVARAIREALDLSIPVEAAPSPAVHDESHDEEATHEHRE